MLSFNSIDLETANVDRSSICQIGIVRVENGKITDQWKTLVDPEVEFDSLNIRIHGIKEEDIAGCLSLPQLYGELRDRLNGTVVVSHTAFDRVAVGRALAKYGLDPLVARWLDSAQVARRAWPEEFGSKGWSLKRIAKWLSISFQHHDALEDARVAAQIVLSACESCELDIERWLERVKSPVFGPSKGKRQSSARRSVAREGHEDGTLFGETIVITGRLSAKRNQVANLAAAARFNVRANVTKKTTMLVIGIQDKSRLRGQQKSRKQRYAEQLIDQGADIQILSEADFCELANIETLATESDPYEVKT